jgi:hypothetical protein
MTTKNVLVTQVIEVTIDESKFNETFMKEFRENFYNYTTINHHIEHLGQLYARGMVGDSSDSFIEGYGRAKDMSIKFVESSTDTEII